MGGAVESSVGGVLRLLGRVVLIGLGAWIGFVAFDGLTSPGTDETGEIVFGSLGLAVGIATLAAGVSGIRQLVIGAILAVGAMLAFILYVFSQGSVG